MSSNNMQGRCAPRLLLPFVLLLVVVDVDVADWRGMAVVVAGDKAKGEQQAGALPPRWGELGEEVQAAMLMQGDAGLRHYFVDDSNKGRGTHIAYSQASIERMVDSITGQLWAWANDDSAEPFFTALVAAFPSNPGRPLAGKRVVVFGSMEPFFESLALALGAEHVTVLEYNALTYAHPQITTVRVKDAPWAALEGRFHVAISASAFDHDGLGRYGDPINPEGDVLAMHTAKRLLTTATPSFLLLSLPLFPEDLVAWNLMRLYGPKRFPRLLHGWGIVERVGWDREMVGWDVAANHKGEWEQSWASDGAARMGTNYRKTYEPVFVLRPVWGGSDAALPRSEL